MENKRRARIKYSAEVVEGLLSLPGRVVGVRMLEGPYATIEFKLEGERLPVVPEGALIPLITVDEGEIREL